MSGQCSPNVRREERLGVIRVPEDTLAISKRRCLKDGSISWLTSQPAKSAYRKLADSF